jgi:hypothetical protein
MQSVLLRELDRCGEHNQLHPQQPVVTVVTVSNMSMIDE